MTTEFGELIQFDGFHLTDIGAQELGRGLQRTGFFISIRNKKF